MCAQHISGVQGEAALGGPVLAEKTGSKGRSGVQGLYRGAPQGQGCGRQGEAASRSRGVSRGLAGAPALVGDSRWPPLAGRATGWALGGGGRTPCKGSDPLCFTCALKGDTTSPLPVLTSWGVNSPHFFFFFFISASQKLAGRIQTLQPVILEALESRAPGVTPCCTGPIPSSPPDLPHEAEGKPHAEP